MIYNGDQGQRFIQITDSQRISDADTGSEVFQTIRNGNGTFNATAPTANTGSLVVTGLSVLDPTAYDEQNYEIRFPDSDTLEVIDGGGATILSQPYVDGANLSFAGIELELSGSPATGDRVLVDPSENQSAFATLDSIAAALDMPNYDNASTAQSRNALNGGLYDLDQVLGNLLEIRTDVGSRLSTVETQPSGTR